MVHYLTESHDSMYIQKWNEGGENMEPIYFNKIEYTERIMGPMSRLSRIIINIPEREFSYQVSKFIYKKGFTPSIHIEKFGDYTDIDTNYYPIKLVKGGKDGFAGRIFIEDLREEDVVFSYAEKLNEKQMKELLPYCNALNFEPYRGRQMSMDDKGFIGYRDEVRLSFRATTDSYIPMIELPMNLLYDEAHTWPSEKLYRYIMEKYLSDKKKFKGNVIPYGGLCLFG